MDKQLLIFQMDLYIVSLQVFFFEKGNILLNDYSHCFPTQIGNCVTKLKCGFQEFNSIAPGKYMNATRKSVCIRNFRFQKLSSCAPWGAWVLACASLSGKKK